VIRKLRDSKKYYKADLFSAIRKDFRSRANLNGTSFGEIKSKSYYPKKFEVTVVRAEKEELRAEKQEEEKENWWKSIKEKIQF